jgi:hypothetical protein
MEHASPLDSAATLCLSAGDVDYLYIDTPDDKKAHIASVLVEVESGTATVAAFAGADDSSLGSVDSTGADKQLILVLGAGTRTYLRLKPFTGGGVVRLTSTLEAETDAFEPNDERDQATEIVANEDVTAQFHAGYTSQATTTAQDWYQATLAKGPHTLHVTHVPEDIALSVKVLGPNGAQVGAGYVSTRGQLLDVSFTAATEGAHSIEFGFFVGPPNSFYVGKAGDSVADTYTFNVTE